MLVSVLFRENAIIIREVSVHWRLISRKRHSESLAVINRLNLTFDCEPISQYNRLMKTYNWQQPYWPHFRYDVSELHKYCFPFQKKWVLLAVN